MKSRNLLRALIIIVLFIFIISLSITINNVSKLEAVSTSTICNSALNGAPCAKTSALWPAFAVLVLSSLLLGGMTVSYARPKHY